MKFYLYIEGDTNDGDYIGRLREINEIDIPRIKKVTDAIKNNPEIEWSVHEYTDETYEDFIEKGLVSEEDADFFNGFIPYGETGVHTIEKINLIKVESEEDLLSA